MPGILVIDDNKATCDLLQLICSHAGYEVVSCFTAEEGLVLAEQMLPQLIFVDLQLPGDMDGWKAIRMIKHNAGLSGAVVIAMSAGTHQQSAEEAGSDGYLEKPFTSQQVVACIQRYI